MSSELTRRTPRRPERAESESDDDDDRYEPPEGTWNPELPFGGKVKVARRKIPDPAWITVIKVLVCLSVLFISYYSYYNIDDVIFKIHRVYAHFGHTEAQHKVGQRYLQGVGVEQNHKEAIKWFKRAAKQGHPESSYNVGVAHLKGHTQLSRGEAKKLIKHAAKNGIKEAHHVLNNVCKQNKKCEH